jgi:hypothetical protein
MTIKLFIASAAVVLACAGAGAHVTASHHKHKKCEKNGEVV